MFNDIHHSNTDTAGNDSTLLPPAGRLNINSSLSLQVLQKGREGGGGGGGVINTGCQIELSVEFDNFSSTRSLARSQAITPPN